MGCENQGVAQAQAPQCAAKPPESATILDIPTRLQWENGHGFCGETCIQACSLYNGNYISQLEVRKLAGG